MSEDTFDDIESSETTDDSTISKENQLNPILNRRGKLHIGSMMEWDYQISKKR